MILDIEKQQQEELTNRLLQYDMGISQPAASLLAIAAFDYFNEWIVIAPDVQPDVAKTIYFLTADKIVHRGYKCSDGFYYSDDDVYFFSNEVKAFMYERIPFAPKNMHEL